MAFPLLSHRIPKTVLSFGGHTQMKVHVPKDAFCSVTASSRGAMCICAHRANVSLIGWWREAGAKRAELMKRSSAVERWLSRTAAPGVHRGWGREREAPFCGCIEVGRRPAASKLQLWRTKGQAFPAPSLYLFLSWRDGAVSSRSPEELPLMADIYQLALSSRYTG